MTLTLNSKSKTHILLTRVISYTRDYDRPLNSLDFLASGIGIGPMLSVSETGVRPLDEPELHFEYSTVDRYSLL